jgi:hypothetical protein
MKGNKPNETRTNRCARKGSKNFGERRALRSLGCMRGIQQHEAPRFCPPVASPMCHDAPMIELKKKHLKYRDGASYWELLFKHPAGEQVALLSKQRGLSWKPGALPETIAPLLDDWSGRHPELVDDLKKELP